MRSLGLAERIPAGRKSGALAAIAVVLRKDRRFVVEFDVMQPNITAANDKGKRKIASKKQCGFETTISLGLKSIWLLLGFCDGFVREQDPEFLIEWRLRRLLSLQSLPTAD